MLSKFFDLLLLIILGLFIYGFAIILSIIVFTWPAIFNLVMTLYLCGKRRLADYKRYLTKDIRKKLTVGGIVTFVLAAIGLLADLTGIGILGQWEKNERMTGDIRIAIANFAIVDSTGDTRAAISLAHDMTQKLSEMLIESNDNFSITIWGPDRVGHIHGINKIERAKSAAAIAEQTGANLIIYGLVDNSELTWYYTPEFYINAPNYYEASEITGAYELGLPILMVGQGNIADRIEFSNELSVRSRILTYVTVGLAYYANHNYERAGYYWQKAADISSKNNYIGQKILYLLLGNAAGKNNQLELAQIQYEKCLSIDPAYARAYIGLANIYYLRGLGNVLNVEMLYESIHLLKLAEVTPDHDELADISAKVHFSLGQNYLLLNLADRRIDIDIAIKEFNAVINEYSNGANPRIRILAGESHARLGLIMKESGDFVRAMEEYNIAVDLLKDLPERQRIYLERIKELRHMR